MLHDRYGIAPERSTKAGAETPATQDVRRIRRAGPQRSTKAGAETPATLRNVGVERQPVRASLNEGRGRDPGDTRQAGPGRSTKAGAETATRLAEIPETVRSTKAGAETPATPPRPDRSAMSLGRSTKAGAETPATLLIHAGHLHRPDSGTDLATHDPDLDRLFGPCSDVHVVADTQMPAKSATSHNLQPGGA